MTKFAMFTEQACTLQSMAIFRGSFLFLRALFYFRGFFLLHFGGEIARSPRVIFSLLESMENIHYFTYIPVPLM